MGGWVRGCMLLRLRLEQAWSPHLWPTTYPRAQMSLLES